MDLTLAAIIIMGGWVVAIVAAGLVMILRPGGVAVPFAVAPIALPEPTGRRDEILLGGVAEGFGNGVYSFDPTTGSSRTSTWRPAWRTARCRRPRSNPPTDRCCASPAAGPSGLSMLLRLRACRFGRTRP